MSINHNSQPKVGDFYYHFKHNSELSICNYAYKIIGLGMHTETDEIMVVYKALYQLTGISKFDNNLFIRPLLIFCENVEKPELNYFDPRFNQILDIDLIKKLKDKISLDI